VIESYDKEYGDKTFGFKNKDIYFFIGNSRVKFEGDNLEIGEKICKGTPGHLDLISMEKPKIKDATKTDKDKYLEILNETGALYELNKNEKLKIKAPSSKKHRNIMKPLRDEKNVKY